MFTVFFAGNAFAPKRKVRRGLHRQWTTDPERLVSLQDFLQDSLAEAFGQLADRLKDIGCVIGFEVGPLSLLVSLVPILLGVSGRSSSQCIFFPSKAHERATPRIHRAPLSDDLGLQHRS